GSFKELFDQRFGFVVVEARVVRMNADRRVDVGVSPAHLDRTFEDAAVGIPGADVQNRRDAGCNGTFEHLIAIRVKLRTINVRMRIDEHTNYLRRAPFGTSSVNVAITGRPSSP